MSKTQHTPGPWRANKDHFGAVRSEPGFSIKGSNSEGVNAIAFLWSRDVEAEQEANARRIVACVNACEGISTEALEAGAVKETLETLEKISRLIGVIETPRVRAIAREAIAKAKGAA